MAEGSGTFNVERGTKSQLMIKIEGTHVKMPLSMITGLADGPTVLITSGIHGSEYPGTLAAVELARELRPEDVSGRLLMIHPVNTQAFKARFAMILPEDGRDINRVFPGRPDGSPSEKVAWRITEFQRMADFYIDLHSGDVFEDMRAYVYYPGSGPEEVVEKSRRAAAVVNVPYMAPTTSEIGTIVSAAAAGIPGLFMERGGAGACPREEVDLYKRDILNVLKHLGLLKGAPEMPPVPPVELGRLTYQESGETGLWISEVELDQKVESGQKLGEVQDFFGQTLAAYHAEHDGVVLYKLRALSANSGDVLVCYGRP
ncbi:succinylglutamate desuccinylase [Deltaproteobacteria bacterium Smac51]|nr:succinylglutamate desuccinylase [Deltaproteobacteria bacterium Smac51]